MDRCSPAVSLLWDGRDFNTAQDGGDERRDSISVLWGCQGFPVAVIAVEGHRDRGQKEGWGQIPRPSGDTALTLIH